MTTAEIDLRKEGPSIVEIEKEYGVLLLRISICSPWDHALFEGGTLDVQRLADDHEAGVGIFK